MKCSATTEAISLIKMRSGKCMAEEVLDKHVSKHWMEKSTALDEILSHFTLFERYRTITARQQGIHTHM